MERTLANIAGQLVRRHESRNRPVRSRVRKVNYETRHIQVSRNGAYIRHIKVQSGIQLGTSNTPIVKVGDVAMIERDPVTQKWLCTEIRSKTRCATGNAPASEVEADTGAEVSYSATTQQWSASIVPDSLFLPPLEALGQLTLPEQQQELICGLPRCTDCAPDGYAEGMALVISSDAEHPAGCWKWGFRRGRVLCRAQIPLVIWGGNDALNDGSVAVRGHYAYCAIPSPQIAGVFSGNAQLMTIDLSDPDVPVLVDTQDVGEEWMFVAVHVNDDATKLWMSGTNDPVSLPNSRMSRFDLSNPAAPSLDTIGDCDLTSTWSIVNVGGTDYLFGMTREWSSTFPIGYMDAYYYVVVNSSTFATIGSYDPNPAPGLRVDEDIFIHNRPIQCGDQVIVKSRDYLQGLDISTPSSPVAMWSETPLSTVDLAIVAVDNTYFYTADRLVDLSNPSAPSFTVLSNSGFNDTIGYYKVFGEMVYEAGISNFALAYNASAFESYSIYFPTAPSRTLNRTCFSNKEFDNIQQFGDSDLEGTIIYLCCIGRTDVGLYLTVGTVDTSI